MQIKITKQTFADYVQIIIGSVLLGLSYNLFFVPNNIVTGGISGIGVILHHLLGTPVGLVSVLLNIPLFIAGLRWGGGVTTGVRTVISVLLMAATIDLTAGRLPEVTHSPLLYITYGGLLDGLGLGLVLRAQGTTGGTDIIGRLLRRFIGLEVSRGIFISNALIVVGAAAVFGLERAMYGVMAVAISTWAVDTVLAGGRRVRQAMIISERWETIRDSLLTVLGRGVTVISGRGGYTDRDRPLLICIISRGEIAVLRRLVRQIDPEAFVVISDAMEVWGEGFSEIDSEI